MKAVSKLTDLENRFDKEITDLKSTIVKEKPYNSQEMDGRTRSDIAIKFTNWYFRLLAAVVALTIIYNFIMAFANKPESIFIKLQDGILAISTAIGTPLGFVVGYYFKESDKS